MITIARVNPVSNRVHDQSRALVSDEDESNNCVQL